MNYTEIFRLKEMLEEAHIPFVFADERFGNDNYIFYHYHIYYPSTFLEGNCVCSVVQGSGTYGNNANLLEIMGLLKPDESGESVKGWLTAEDVFERIKEHYEKEGAK